MYNYSVEKRWQEDVVFSKKKLPILKKLVVLIFYQFELVVSRDQILLLLLITYFYLVIIYIYIWLDNISVCFIGFHKFLSKLGLI